MSDASILTVSSLVAGYGDLTIVRGVDLAVEAGSLVSVIGPNGAGKSTLLKAIYGILRPSAGTITLHADGGDVELRGLRPSAVTRLGLNYVPQLDNVFPNMSVLENLEVGATLRGRERRRTVDAVLERSPLLRDRRRQRAGTLSGGQRKVLALARALLSEPRLLVLDEPSAGLSPIAADEVFAQLVDINRGGVSIVMVEQNARRALALSDYAYVLDMGRNRYEGRGSELLSDDRIAELYLGRRGARRG